MENFLEYLRQTLGEYEIIENTGNGYFVLELKKTYRQAAVKKISDYSLYEKLKHTYIEGIPAVYDVIEYEGCRYSVEEYINGITLSEIIKETGTLYSSEAAEAIIKLCDIAAELNGYGIYGTDFSPENIVISKDKLYIISLEKASGKAFYTSPEVKTGAEPDSKSDVYAIGRLLSFLISAQENKEPNSTAAYYKIIKKASHIKPEKRYKNTQKLKKAFKTNTNTVIYVIAFLILIALTVIVCAKYSFKTNGINALVTYCENGSRLTD